MRTLTYTRGGPEPVRSFNQTHRGIVLINKHRSFAVNALTLSAKLALAVCSMITLSTVANATENVPVNGDVHMSAALYTVSESAGSVALTVERSGGDTGVVSVTYFTQNDARDVPRLNLEPAEALPGTSGHGCLYNLKSGNLNLMCRTSFVEAPSDKCMWVRGITIYRYKLRITMNNE